MVNSRKRGKVAAEREGEKRERRRGGEEENGGLAVTSKSWGLLSKNSFLSFRAHKWFRE